MPFDISDSVFTIEDAPLWTPVNISGCFLWLRSDLGVTHSGNPDIVSKIEDQALSNDFTQNTVAQRPGWVAGSPSYMSFSGINWMNAAVFGVAGNVSVTAFVWAYVKIGDSYQSPITWGDASGALTAFGMFLNFSGDRSFSLETAGGNGARSGSEVYILNQWNLFCINKTSGALNVTTVLEINGVNIDIDSASSGIPNVTETNIPFLGDFGGANYPFSGNLDQVVLYSPAISIEDRAVFYANTKGRYEG